MNEPETFGSVMYDRTDVDQVATDGAVGHAGQARQIDHRRILVHRNSEKCLTLAKGHVHVPDTRYCSRALADAVRLECIEHRVDPPQQIAVP